MWHILSPNIGIGWALEVFMQQNGNIIFSNNLNNNLLTGSFPLETWFELKIAVNITNNQWYVYIDDLLIGRGCGNSQAVGGRSMNLLIRRHELDFPSAHKKQAVMHHGDDLLC